MTHSSYGDIDEDKMLTVTSSSLGKIVAAYS